MAELKATKGISVARANKIVSHLCGWRHYIGPFTENRIPDINAGVAALREATPVDGKPFKPNTQRDYITILKQFYLWLIENEYSTVQAGRIRKIQKPPQARMTKTASELLQPDEIARMILACKSNRDRAMVSMIYEGALRTEEVGQMTWDQVQITEHGVVVTVSRGIQKVISLFTTITKPMADKQNANPEFAAIHDEETELARRKRESHDRVNHTMLVEGAVELLEYYYPPYVAGRLAEELRAVETREELNHLLVKIFPDGRWE